MSSFKKKEIYLLQYAHVKCIEKIKSSFACRISSFFNRIEYEMEPSDDTSSSNTDLARVLSEEDKELLSLYQHSFDDDRVDISLILQLLVKILSTSKEGVLS